MKNGDTMTKTCRAPGLEEQGNGSGHLQSSGKVRK